MERLKFILFISLLALNLLGKAQTACICQPDMAAEYLLAEGHPCRAALVNCAIEHPSIEYVDSFTQLIRKNTDNPNACATSTYALGEMRNPAAIPVLIDHLEHAFLDSFKDMPYLMGNPPSALIKLGEPCLKPLLISLERYQSPQTRQVMGSMIYQICQSKAGAIGYLQASRQIHPQGVADLIQWINKITESS